MGCGSTSPCGSIPDQIIFFLRFSKMLETLSSQISTGQYKGFLVVGFFKEFLFWSIFISPQASMQSCRNPEMLELTIPDRSYIFKQFCHILLTNSPNLQTIYIDIKEKHGFFSGFVGSSILGFLLDCLNDNPSFIDCWLLHGVRPVHGIRELRPRYSSR